MLESVRLASFKEDTCYSSSEFKKNTFQKKIKLMIYSFWFTASAYFAMQIEILRGVPAFTVTKKQISWEL